MSALKVVNNRASVFSKVIFNFITFLLVGGMLIPAANAQSVTNVTSASSVTLNSGNYLDVVFDINSFQANLASNGGGQLTQLYFMTVNNPVNPSSLTLSGTLKDVSLNAVQNFTPTFVSSTTSSGTTYPVTIGSSLINISNANYQSLFGTSGMNSVHMILTNTGSSAETLGAPSVPWYPTMSSSIVLSGIAALNRGGTLSTGVTITSIQLVQSVPEPETFGMLTLGLGLVGFIARRRKTA